jgi:hypothetical protein
MTVLQTRVFRLRRQRFPPEAGGGTMHFVSCSGKRKPPFKFWRPEEVPEFEGAEGCFEAEYVRSHGWRIVRQVECAPHHR